MAELGDISTINVNAGTQPEDTRALEAGVRQGLGLIASLHEDKVLDEAGDKIKADLAQAVVDAQAVEVFDDDIDTTQDPVVDALRRKIIDAQQDVINGDTSLRARAELIIQDSLTKMRDAHPRLAAKISSEIAGVVAANPALNALGLADAALKSQASTATKFLTDLRDRAIKPVESGGLGMSIISDFTDPRVLRELVEKDKKRTAMNATDLQLGFIIAKAGSTAEENMNAVVNASVGYDSQFHELQLAQMASFAEYIAEVGKPPAEQSASIIDSFAERKEDMIQKNNALIVDIQSIQATVWKDPAQRGTKFYALAQAVIDDRIKLIEAWTTGLRDQKTAQYYDIQIAALQSEAMQLSHKLPSYRELLRFAGADPDGLIYKMISDSMTGADVLVKDNLSQVAIQALGGLFAYKDRPAAIAGLYYNSGQGLITPDMTPSQITGLLRTNQRTGVSPFGNFSVGETEDIAAGMNELAQMQVYLGNMGDDPSAEVAATVLTTAASVFLLYNDIGNPAPNQMELAMDVLSDPNFLLGLKAAGDTTYKNRRFALADAAQNFLGDDNLPYAQARTEAQNAWRGARLGRELSDFVDVSVNAFKDGDTLDVNILTDEIALAVFNEVSTGLPFVGGPSFKDWRKANQGQITTQVRKVTQEAQRIIGFANRDIRASAHVHFANQDKVEGANEPSYALWAERTGWLDVLGGL